MKVNAQTVYYDVERIRKINPLVHNITNYVVMNNTANALLAIGASPVMAHAIEEVEDMVGIASALVVNIGTLSPAWVEGMKKAIKAASSKGIPIVFDPVGAGATHYRNQTAEELLKTGTPSIIRGNASEIMALSKSTVSTTKGVDSSQSSESAVEAAQRLASEFSCVVSISGEIDFIVTAKEIHKVANGHSLMPRVTGLGCTASALTGACAAVNDYMFAAAVNAMYIMGIAGEIAATKAQGTGSMQMHFIDALNNLNEQQIKATIRNG
jgi:hydroxyethylthiazole kinase